MIQFHPAISFLGKPLGVESHLTQPQSLTSLNGSAPMSCPSMMMHPPASPIMRKSAMSRVVFPLPVRPTMPTWQYLKTGVQGSVLSAAAACQCDY